MGKGEDALRKLLALLMLVAGPAFGANKYYISPIGSDSLNGAVNTSGTAAHPFRTFSYSLQFMESQDTLICLPSAGVIASGHYPDRMVMYHREQVIIGDSTAPNKVVVPGLTASATSTQWPDIQINGIRFTEGADINDYPNGSGVVGSVDGIVIRNCVFFCYFNAVNVDFHLYNCRVGPGRDSVSCYFRSLAYTSPVRAIIDSCVITVGPIPYTDYNDFAWAINTTNTLNYPNTFTITRSAITIFKPYGWGTTPNKPTMFQGLNDCRFSQNTWTFLDSSGVDGSGFGFLFRDRLLRNKWTNETFTLTTLINGHGNGRLDFVGPGSNASENWFNVGNGNVWKYCNFKGNIPNTGPLFNYDWQIQNGDSFYRNVVICSTGVNRSGFHIHNVVGTSIVKRNTFVNLGTGGAVTINDQGAVCTGNYWTGYLVFTGNILYTRSTGTTSNDYALGIELPSLNPWHFVSDYNLFAHYGGNGARSVHGGECGITAQNYTIAQWQAAALQDYHSTYGSPQFTDTSSYANFDARILAGSSALSLVTIDTTAAGAYDIADTLRPYKISDLIVAGTTSNSAIVQFTSTGDDSLTGTATSYDLRYSSTAITDETSFNAGTRFTIAAPLQSGTATTATITGLSAATTYYFAIKIIDEVNNKSAISNVVTATTSPAGAPGRADP